MAHDAWVWILIFAVGVGFVVMMAAIAYALGGIMLAAEQRRESQQEDK